MSDSGVQGSDLKRLRNLGALVDAVLVNDAAAWARTIRLRLDASTGTIETSGLPRLCRFRGGLNLGNFTFLIIEADDFHLHVRHRQAN